MSEYIIGKNTIAEVLKHKPDILLQIYTSKEKSDPLILEIMKKNILISFLNKNALSSMVKTESHQNIIAKIKQRNYYNSKEYLKTIQDKPKANVIMLDSIYDPQNFGAILRASECFSIDAVIFSKNRGSDITPVVTKAAAGATELVNLIKVSNLATTLDEFKDEGFSVIATSLDKDARNLHTFDFPGKALIIMGSEGEGIQQILLKKADFSLRIPMSGKLQSLNVSQATAVILSIINYKNT